MKFRLTCFLAAACVLCVISKAQDTADLKVIQQDVAIMQEALSLRTEMAALVGSADEQPADALERLRAANLPSGLRISADAGFAYAAIDIGQRLIVLRKPAESEPFFQAAEAALDRQVQQTPDTQAKYKAQYLQKLALIRGNYLNKAAQAKEDIDAAIKLQPDDKGLMRFRAVLSADKAEYFKRQDGKEESAK